MRYRNTFRALISFFRYWTAAKTAVCIYRSEKVVVLRVHRDFARWQFLYIGSGSCDCIFTSLVILLLLCIVLEDLASTFLLFPSSPEAGVGIV